MLKSIFTALLLAAVSSTTPAFSEDMKLVRNISLSGHGEVHAIPDLAIINLGICIGELMVLSFL